jgi:hypothetical protein
VICETVRAQILPKKLSDFDITVNSLTYQGEHGTPDFSHSSLTRLNIYMYDSIQAINRIAKQIYYNLIVLLVLLKNPDVSC